MKRILLVLAILGVVITVSAAAAARREREEARSTQAEVSEIIPGTGGTARSRLQDNMCRSTTAAEDLIALVDEDGDDRATQQEIDKFAQRLAKLDENNDKYITIDEAGHAAVMNIRDATVWKLRNRYDENKDNAVSMAELGRDRTVYATLDVDRNGSIDSGDIAAIGEEACYASGIAPESERGVREDETGRPPRTERRSRTPKRETDYDIEEMRDILPTVTIPEYRPGFYLAADTGLEIRRDDDLFGDDEIEVEYDGDEVFEWDDDEEAFEWGDDYVEFDYSWGDDDDWDLEIGDRDTRGFIMDRDTDFDLDDDWGDQDGRYDYWWGDEDDVEADFDFEWGD